MNWLYNADKPAKEKEKKKIWIIDYSFYIWNGSFAYKYPCKCTNVLGEGNPNCNVCEGTGKIYMHAHDGTITGGLYAVFKMAINKTLEGYQVITVFDPPKEDLKRTKLLDTYKGNRGEKPEWISNQMLLGEQILPYTNVECYTSVDDESDDVMATLAIELADQGHYVVVASDDKDMFPLVQHPNIDIYRMKEIFTYDSFKSKFAFEPERFNEYLAICGDAADNFNLLEGLGPKAAEYIIQNTATCITEVFDSLESFPEKYVKKLVECGRGDLGCVKTKAGCCSCPNMVAKKKELMELSLKIATLETKAKYMKINKEIDINKVHKDLVDLNMNWVSSNVNCLF
jgi:5'-3' exonuclease